MTPSTAEFWVIVVPVFTTAIIQVINALSTRHIRKQVTPPSNGKTLGQLAESVVNSSFTAAVESTRTRQAILPHEAHVEPPIPTEEGTSRASQTEQPAPPHLEDQSNPGPTVP